MFTSEERCSMEMPSAVAIAKLWSCDRNHTVIWWLLEQSFHLEVTWISHSYDAILILKKRVTAADISKQVCPDIFEQSHDSLSQGSNL